MIRVNNLETINMDDFEKLEETVAPSFCSPVMRVANFNNYNINIANKVSNSCGTTVNNVFTFH